MLPSDLQPYLSTLLCDDISQLIIEYKLPHKKKALISNKWHTYQKSYLDEIKWISFNHSVYVSIYKHHVSMIKTARAAKIQKYNNISNLASFIREFAVS
jgi:hypothetical protein